MNTTTLKYDGSWGKHKLMGLGGWSYEDYRMNFLNARGQQVASDDESQRFLECASNVAWLLSGRKEWALMSGFLRFDYSFADRYLLSASFRADGSSKFAKKNRWGYFPSVSGAWRISEEAFFEMRRKSCAELQVACKLGH